VESPNRNVAPVAPGVESSNRTVASGVESSNRTVAPGVESSNRNVVRGRATREHLVAVATRLFAERGFDDTSIELVLQTAGVSRGALYHHFSGKDALFEAALEAVGADVGRRGAAAATGLTDPYAVLRAACLAWVEIAGDPVVQRIMLIDAPAVLGWHRWRALDEQNTLGEIRAALLAMATAGRLAPELVDMFAHVVLASMNEIALVIARADDSAAAMRDGAVAVDEFLRRLLEPANSADSPARQAKRRPRP
jgi:AcrR family transcriptional regulator